MLFVVGVIASLPVGFAFGFVAMSSFLIIKGVLKLTVKKIFS